MNKEIIPGMDVQLDLIRPVSDNDQEATFPLEHGKVQYNPRPSCSESYFMLYNDKDEYICGEKKPSCKVVEVMDNGDVICGTTDGCPATIYLTAREFDMLSKQPEPTKAPLWLRLGVTIEPTGQEVADLLGDDIHKANAALTTIIKEGRFVPDGESYFPSNVIADYNRDHGTHFDTTGDGPEMELDARNFHKKKPAKEQDLDFIRAYARETRDLFEDCAFVEKKHRDILRSLWTFFCMKYNLTWDSEEYRKAEDLVWCGVVSGETKTNYWNDDRRAFSLFLAEFVA